MYGEAEENPSTLIQGQMAPHTLLDHINARCSPAFSDSWSVLKNPMYLPPFAPSPPMASPPPLPPTPAELDELLLLVHDARTTSYLSVAALALLIYDHILSLDHEIEFVWNKRKSFGGYLYLWVRTSDNTLFFRHHVMMLRIDTGH
ncbi:hypothetical protein FB451DRAFT_1226487 [Mycena latifolia]|nr:hypothetical protein FB451DRAFT_1226487 [Mycena latifolia]